jgi:threonine dehydrogenase-like Zn-dependent dehydrogenase
MSSATKLMAHIPISRATSTCPFSPFDLWPSLKILKINGGSPPRVVIDSTGNSKVFQTALGLVQDFGTLVLLGDTGQPGMQALTPDVITRGL